MRQIKFDAIYKPTGEHFIPNTLDFKQNIVTGNFDGSIGDWCHFSLDGKYGDVILRQCTGLKDKNDKDIYEGDIVRYLDGNEWSTESGYNFEEFDNLGVIFFDEECGRYDVTNKQGIGYDDLFDCGVDFEIVGNIHENPELLTAYKF